MMPFCAILLTIGVVNAVVRVPLVHRPKTLQELRKVRAKRASRGVSKEAQTSVHIDDTLDMEYSGEILVGTPPKKFVVLFETGTANLWLPGIRCSDCWFGPGNFYDNSSSSSWYPRPDLGIFKNPLVNGTYAKDTVIIGGLPIENQTFADVYEQLWAAMIDAPFDGIMGLGCDQLAIDGITPPIYNMFTQGKIKHTVFGIFLDSFEGNASLVTIGGTEKSLYAEDLFWSPWSPLHMYSPSNLIIGDDVKVNHKTANACDPACQFVFDTGAGVLVLPPRGNQVMQMLGIPPLMEGAQEELNCSSVDSMPPLTFTINGKDFDLGPEFYVAQIIDYDTLKKVCTLAMEAIDPPLSNSSDKAHFNDYHVVTLGDPFQRKYYTAYDYDRGRVGIALAIQPASHAMFEGGKNARLQTDTQMFFM